MFRRGLLMLYLIHSFSVFAADPNKVLRIEFYVAETGFDPVLVHDLYSNTVIEAILEPLLTYDYLAQPAKLIPRAAEALPVITDNGKTFTFKIRKGVYFTPDPAFKGKKRELTAEDYAYSIKRFKDPKFTPRPYEFLINDVVGLDELKKQAEKSGKFDYQAKIPGLEVVDRYTLRIRLNNTDYSFAYALAMPIFGAVAREVIEAYPNDTNAHPVGTGPYKLKEWKRANKIILEANPEFRGTIWDFQPSNDPGDAKIIAAMKGKKLPQIGTVEISIIEEQQSAWLSFQKNELDIIFVREQVAPDALPNNQLKADLAKRGIYISRIVDPEIGYIYFNMRDPTFGGMSKEKIALRRAILMAYNTAEHIRTIRRNQAVEVHYVVPPGVVGHDPNYRTSLPYDPKAANDLLDKFGYKRGKDGYRSLPDGKPLVFTYTSEQKTRDREFDELWKKSLDAIGIRLAINKMKFPEILKGEKQCKVVSRNAAWIADYPDGDNFFQLLYGPNTNQSNNACFQNAEWDKLYEKSKQLPPSPERDKLYREMARMVEVYGVWKVTDARYRNMLVQPRVLGFKKHPILLADWLYVDIDNKAN